MKRKANSPPPYSILNPDTNSDSPSAKSKGARFVSAKHLINHMKNNGMEITRNPVNWCLGNSLRLNVIVRIRIVISTSAILTSYEIVWAIARIEPSKEYLELDAQPDSKIV